MIRGSYFTLDLPIAQLQQAYPLIQIRKKDCTLDQWLEYGKSLYRRPDDGGGILSVQTRRRYIYALATYEICAQLIQVQHFCAVDFVSRTPGQLLVDALELRGRTRACIKIDIHLPSAAIMTRMLSDLSLHEFLEGLGYVRKDDLFSRNLH